MLYIVSGELGGRFAAFQTAGKLYGACSRDLRRYLAVMV